MSAPATGRAVSGSVTGRTATAGALFLAACLVWAAPPALAQTGWATVVAPADATEPSKPAAASAPAKPAASGVPAAKKAAAAKTTKHAKASAAPVTTTGSIKPAAEPESETVAGTRVAADEPAEPAEPAQPQPPAQAQPGAQEKAAPKPEPQAAKPSPALEAPAFSTPAARQFCINITDAAADARVAWQKKALLDVAQDVDKRVAQLEEKIAEYQKWVTRRDEFVKKAHDSLVLIYSRMRPDAAALQLVAMDEETAAAVLLRLDARAASTILNEMEPNKAARLTAIINGAAKDPPGPRANGGSAGAGKS